LKLYTTSLNNIFILTANGTSVSVQGSGGENYQGMRLVADMP